MAEITIRDLAEACGVSISTVSKALRRSERISEATVRRIEEKARELGYVGNRAASTLSAKRRTVGVFLPSAPEETAARYRAGLHAAAPVLSSYGIDLEERTPEEGVDGLAAVLAAASLVPRLFPPDGLPVATVGRARDIRPVAEAVPDYRIGGRLAAQFLAFATGGGTTAILAARRASYAEEEAIRGFRELSHRLGTPPAAIIECGEGARGVRTEVRRLLAAVPRLRGLFVTAPLVGAVAAAMADLRKKPLLVGLDFTRPALEALRAGDAAALLYTAPERLAERAILGLAAHLSGQSAGTCTVRTELVLKSNLESYL